MKPFSRKHIRIFGRMAALMALWTGLFMILPVVSHAATPAYTIQAGAFKDSYKALKLAADLTGKGMFAVYWKESTKPGDEWHKVFLGKYGSREAAMKASRTFMKNRTIPRTAFIRIFPGLSQAPAADVKPDDRITGKEETSPAVIPEIKAAATPVEAPAAREPVVMPSVLPPEKTAPAEASVSSSPTPSTPPVNDGDLSQIFAEKMVRAEPAARQELRRDQEKNWHLFAGYSLWYVDMSSRYTNSNLAGKGFLHGPTIGGSWDRLTLQFSTLFSIGNLDGNRTGQYTNGSGFTVTDRLKINDYDAVVKYRIDGPERWFSISPLLGFKYTQLADMNSAYTRDTGQQYNLTGHMDIWGPVLGLEVLIPLGNPRTTPLSLSLSGSGMYLRATGKHPGHLPAQGGAYWTTFDGADFTSSGWGETADVHLTWTIFDALQFLAGGRIQSADLTDTSPAGTTMRISNGFIGAYGNLNLVW